MTSRIAAGGASVMDCGKLPAFGACHTSDWWDYVKGRKNPYGQGKLLLILMPTYPSSGSEYGLGAVSADGEAGDSSALPTASRRMRRSWRPSTPYPWAWTCTLPARPRRRKFVSLFQGAAPEGWMLEKAEYTMSRFARMYGMEYVGMASNGSQAKALSGKIRLTLPNVSRSISEYRTEVFTQCVFNSTCAEVSFLFLFDR